MSKKEFVDALQAKPSYLLRKQADKIKKTEDELARIHKIRFKAVQEVFKIVEKAKNWKEWTMVSTKELYQIADELEKEGK